MGKRFEKNEPRPRDFWPTPKKAVEPILPHLPKEFTFCEPCAGDGALVSHLEKQPFGGVCLLASDIEPQAEGIIQKNGLDLNEEDVEYCDAIITNPPFTWALLKPLLDHWLSLDRPVILLLPADFMHNIRFGPYMDMCYLAVSIGRVKWIEGSKTAGVDNYAWFFFDRYNDNGTRFVSRKKENKDA